MYLEGGPGFEAYSLSLIGQVEAFCLSKNIHIDWHNDRQIHEEAYQVR